MPADPRSAVRWPTFLITGNPGSGKSTIAAELARRGWSTIDPDDDPELSHWVDKDGNRVSAAAGPPAPDRQWLSAHRWVWSRSRMEGLLAEQSGPVFVCGIAPNMEQFVDLFDRILLLRIDAATQEARLVAHDTHRRSPRSEAGRREIRDGRPVFEAEMLALGAIPVDGTAPTTVLADRVLALIGAV